MNASTIILLYLIKYHKLNIKCINDSYAKKMFKRIKNVNILSFLYFMRRSLILKNYEKEFNNFFDFDKLKDILPKKSIIVKLHELTDSEIVEFTNFLNNEGIITPTSSNFNYSKFFELYNCENEIFYAAIDNESCSVRYGSCTKTDYSDAYDIENRIILSTESFYIWYNEMKKTINNKIIDCVKDDKLKDVLLKKYYVS